MNTTRLDVVIMLLREHSDLPVPSMIEIQGAATMPDIEPSVRFHLSEPADVARWAERFDRMVRLTEHRDYVEFSAVFTTRTIQIRAWQHITPLQARNIAAARDLTLCRDGHDIEPDQLIRNLPDLDDDAPPELLEVIA